MVELINPADHFQGHLAPTLDAPEPETNTGGPNADVRQFSAGSKVDWAVQALTGAAVVNVFAGDFDFY